MRTLNEILLKMIYKNKYERIPTGFTELDKILEGGLPQEGVTLVAGRPGMGKTSFLLDIAINYAKSTGKKVAFFSFDEVEESIALDILGKASKDAEEWHRIFLSPGDLRERAQKDGAEVGELYDEVKDLSILLYWNPTISPFEIKEMCESISKPGMIIIDSGKRLDMGPVAADYLADISNIAASLHLPVICSCNVNRSAEFYEDQRPDYDSIIGGGLRAGIPKPVIIALYREDYYCEENGEEWGNESMCPAEAIVIPCFGIGSSKTANIVWNKRKLRFENE